jgi:hypothetical protein
MELIGICHTEPLGEKELDDLIRRVRIAAYSDRDEAIRRLWCAFRDLSDVVAPDDWEQSDLDLWGQVSAHEAVQSVLGRADADSIESSETQKEASQK